MTLYRRMRLRHGLLWRTNHPPPPLKTTLCLLGIIIAYLIVGYIDRAVIETTEEQTRTLRAEKINAERMLVECLNNEMRMYYRKGDHRVYIICNAQEIEI